MRIYIKVHVSALCSIIIACSLYGGIDERLDRSNAMRAIQAQIEGAATSAERIEHERALAFLWLGEGTDTAIDIERFQREAERIFAAYPDMSHHYSFMNTKVTYAQLQPAEIRSAMLLEVIEFDPREFHPPMAGDPVRWLNRLKQGAVWAYLNGATSDAITAPPSTQKRRFNEEADALVQRMKKTEEGRRCIPLADWWRDVATAQEERAIPIPALDAPPPSRWIKTIEDDRPDITASETNETSTEASLPEPELRQRQRTLDSFEFAGKVIIAEPETSAAQPRRLPWLLGSFGAAFLVFGLVWSRKTPNRAK